jgi:hypothetical protein
MWKNFGRESKKTGRQALVLFSPERDAPTAPGPVRVFNKK